MAKTRKKYAVKFSKFVYKVKKLRNISTSILITFLGVLAASETGLAFPWVFATIVAIILTWKEKKR